MSTAIRIRPLRLSDYEAMIHVFRACYLNPKTRGRDAREAIATQLRVCKGLYLGAFEGERLVGTVLGTHDARKGWINRLAVLPAYRRRGVASRLVRACERALRARGIEMFAALIDEDNAVSQRLFAALGYEDRHVRYFSRKLREQV